MQRIYELTAPFEAFGLELVHIRFPNAHGIPLAGCEAGTIVYVFTPGEVTVCPYLVFAARTPQSKHDPEEFIVGNIFTDGTLPLASIRTRSMIDTRWERTRRAEPAPWSPAAVRAVPPP
jgi:hypothetical protein